MIESYLCNLQHCFMSQEGQAESYNDLWWNSQKVKLIQQFLSQNPAVGRHFDKRISEDDDKDLFGDAAVDRGYLSGMQEMNCKSVSKVCLESVKNTVGALCRFKQSMTSNHCCYYLCTILTLRLYCGFSTHN